MPKKFTSCVCVSVCLCTLLRVYLRILLFWCTNQMVSIHLLAACCRYSIKNRCVDLKHVCSVLWWLYVLKTHLVNHRGSLCIYIVFFVDLFIVLCLRLLFIYYWYTLVIARSIKLSQLKWIIMKSCIHIQSHSYKVHWHACRQLTCTAHMRIIKWIVCFPSHSLIA